ncbi:MAG: YdbH domain-containing protein [Alphaproteobacteria bacterium]
MSSHDNHGDSPSDTPARPFRRRPWTRWIVVVVVVLAVIVAAGVSWRLPLAGGVLRVVLDRAGLHDTTLTVDAISPSRIRLTDVRVGSDITIASADVGFDLARLPGNPVTSVMIDGVEADVAGAMKTLQQYSRNDRPAVTPPPTIRGWLDRAEGIPPVTVKNLSLRNVPASPGIAVTGSAESGPNGAGAYAVRFALRLAGEIQGEKHEIAIDGTAGVSAEVAIAEVRANSGNGAVVGMATGRIELASDNTTIRGTARVDLRDSKILAKLSPWLQGAAGRIELTARTPTPIAIGVDTPLDSHTVEAALQRAGAGGVRLDVKIEDASLGSGTQGTAGTTVQGLSADIRLDRLIPPRTPPGQTVRARQVAAGMTFENLNLRFALIDGAAPVVPALRVEDFQTTFAGGHLGIAPTIIDAAAESSEGTIAVKDVDLAALLALAGLEGVSGTGRLNGKIPIKVAKNAVGIAGGRLQAAGPGTLRIRSDAAKQALAQGGEEVVLMLSALENFHYETLTLEIEKKLTGEGRVLLRTRGKNPNVGDGQPFVINLNLTGNVDRLAVVAAQAFQLPAALIRSMLPK